MEAKEHYSIVKIQCVLGTPSNPIWKILFQTHLAFLLLISLAACEKELGPGEFVDDPLVLTNNYNDNYGQCITDVYPCPPYGTRLSEIVRDIPFLPANPITETMAGEDGIARLADFYALKDQGYKLLLISLTTEWCVECGFQMETMHTILDRYGSTAALPKVAFLVVVTENERLEEATLEVAANYSTAHDFNHLVPATNDENRYFRELHSSSSYPFNIFIDLSTMEIMDYESSLSNEMFFADRLDEMLTLVSQKRKNK
jgi:hypothetical protein